MVSFVMQQYVEIHVVSSHRTNIISLHLFVSTVHICNITLTMVNKPVDRVVLHILAFAGSKFSFPSNCLIFWTSVGV